jgi:peptidoglycan/LPS O-acetylase OafA/YrhL
LQRFYEPLYMLRSLLGFFPRADLWLDVNSVFWFISWILLAYLLFPLLFNEKKPWFSALCLFAITSLLVWWNPQPIEKVVPFYRLHTAALPLGMIAAWLLQSQNVTAQKIQSNLSYIKHDLAAVPHYVLLSVLLAIGVFSLLLETKTPVQEQAGNMITMLAFISVFALKRFEIRLLYWLGFYSFEIYMLHWPLLARYDVFFKYLPASWLAMLAHFVLYIGLGILVQKAAAWVEKRLPI